MHPTLVHLPSFLSTACTVRCNCKPNAVCLFRLVELEEDEQAAVGGLGLLSAKPVIYAANVQVAATHTQITSIARDCNTLLQ